jgi:hypothetical protein
MLPSNALFSVASFPLDLSLNGVITDQKNQLNTDLLKIHVRVFIQKTMTRLKLK